MVILRRRKISKKLRKHVQAEVSSSVAVCLLTIKHEKLSEPVRVSSDPTVRLMRTEENVIYGTKSRGNTYYYAGFDYSLPNDEDGAAPQLNISLSYVTRDIIEAIEDMGTGIVQVDMEICFADTPDIIEIGMYNMELSEVTYDQSSVSFNISRDLLFQEPYPCRSFIPQHYPFLFR